MHLGFHVMKGSRVCGKDAPDGAGSLAGSLTGSCECAVEELRAIGVARPCVQIFIMGPLNGKTTDEIADLRKFATHTRIIIHSAYISAPWNGNVHLLRKELRIADAIGAHGVVVHLGKNASADIIAKILEVGNKPAADKPAADKPAADKPAAPFIWLEINSAKSSEHTFETPEKLHALFSQLDPTQVGLCIDTAHLFACGVSLASREAAETWLRSVQYLMPKVPKMVHLNDTSAELGSGRDVHENLFTGNIWKCYRKRPSDSGVIAIIEWCQRYHYDIIVERSRENPTIDVTFVQEHSM